MDPTDAAADLQSVQQITVRTRQAIAHSGAGHYMIIWGIDWLIGFTGTQFLPQAAGLVWMGAHIAAVAACIVASFATRGVTAGGSGPRSRISLFWGALFAYGILWMWLQPPQTTAFAGLFIATLAMFGYVVMGIWLSSLLFGVVGLSVTVLATAAYLTVPTLFPLVMALLGGGTLVGSGVYVVRCWR